MAALTYKPLSFADINLNYPQNNSIRWAGESRGEDSYASYHSPQPACTSRVNWMIRIIAFISWAHLTYSMLPRKQLWPRDPKQFPWGHADTKDQSRCHPRASDSYAQPPKEHGAHFKVDPQKGSDSHAGHKQAPPPTKREPRALFILKKAKFFHLKSTSLFW